MALDTDKKSIDMFLDKVRDVAKKIDIDPNAIDSKEDKETLHILCNGQKIIHYGIHDIRGIHGVRIPGIRKKGYPAFQLSSKEYPLGTLRIPLIDNNTLKINNMTRSVRDIIVETLNVPRIDNMIISAIHYTNAQSEDLDPDERQLRNDEKTFLKRVQSIAETIDVQDTIDFGPTRTKPEEHIYIQRKGLRIGCYGIEFGHAFQLHDSHPLGELRIPLRVKEFAGLGITNPDNDKQNNEINKSDEIINRILNAPLIEDVINIVIETAILDIQQRK
jgi:hypothetical protein